MDEKEIDETELIHAKLCLIKAKKQYNISLKQEELDLLVRELPKLIME